MQAPIQGVVSFLFVKRALVVLSHFCSTGTDLLPSTPGAVELQQAADEETQG